VTQNAFSESGAQSLQPERGAADHHSQRTTVGADLASSIGLGNERKLDLAVRLGWQHELGRHRPADHGSLRRARRATRSPCSARRPIRDAAVVGFQAVTNIAAATQVLPALRRRRRGGTDNHALTAGLRMSW